MYRSVSFAIHPKEVIMGEFRTAGHGGRGFGTLPSADEMWEAMDQLRSGFEKRVGSRMGRGDVRAAVLSLLSEQPMHGYQVIREIESRTGGRWKPSAGSIYPTLQLLADEGLVVAETAQDRKIYSLTEDGRAEAAKSAAHVPWADTATHEGTGRGALPKAGIDLAQAVSQVARTGTAEQQAKAVEVLDAARRSMYSILAQE
jgi:DNA-binding PadR family transcriptional regulator